MNSNRQDLQDKIINGVIDSVIQQGQEWRVYVQGRYWGALAVQPVDLQPGDRIQVVGRQNIKLLITATQL
jgi:membrane protein implicated in regulation of membrane protease activity